MRRLSVAWELAPALVVLVLALSFGGLMFELAVATVRSKPVDPIAATVLGTIIGACIPALLGFYVRDSRPAPPPPPTPPASPVKLEPTGDAESDAWNKEHGYFPLWWGGSRWKLQL